MSIRTAIAGWLAPELVEAEDRYHRLISRMQDDYWWLGEFPDASETIRYLLDSHRNRYRAIGEAPVGNLPDDIGAFRERLRRRALENRDRVLADANTNPPLSDLSSLRKGVGVAVKPLVWNEYETEGQIDRWDAETALGSFYEISTEFDGYSVSNDHVHTDQRFGTPDEAKAFAQSDYETRIRSALA